jgi:hypothetical protein
VTLLRGHSATIVGGSILRVVGHSVMLRSPRSAALAVLAFALCAVPCHGRDVRLELKDIGIRGHISAEQATFFFEIHNANERPFDGSVSCVLRENDYSLFGRVVHSQVVSHVVAAPAHGSAHVCVALPARAAREERVEFQLRDRQGHLRASSVVKPREVGVAEGGTGLIGILAREASDVKVVQDAMLFSKQSGSTPFFERPSLKILHLSTGLPPCWPCLSALETLVVALPIDTLTEMQRRAVRAAAFHGLRLVLIDSFPGNTDFMREVAQGRSLPAPFGRGTLERAATMAEAPGPSPIPSSASLYAGRRARAGRPRPAEDVFQEERWTDGRFLKARLPRATSLLGAIALYVVAVGPLSYFVLRHRGRREQGWVAAPAIALFFALVLIVWIRVHQFHGIRLDSAVFRYSSAGYRDTRVVAWLQIASPAERDFDLRIAGDWQAGPGYRSELFSGMRPREAVFDRGELRLGGMHTPKWSTSQLALMRDAQYDSPASWRDDALRNDLSVAYDEAVLVTPHGYFETRRLEPGASWRFAAEAGRPLIALRFSPSGVEHEPGRTLQALISAVRFGDEAAQAALLSRVRGIFIGVTREQSIDAALEPAAQERQFSTVYVHVFPVQDAP